MCPCLEGSQLQIFGSFSDKTAKVLVLNGFGPKRTRAKNWSQTIFLLFFLRIEGRSATSCGTLRTNKIYRRQEEGREFGLRRKAWNQETGSSGPASDDLWASHFLLALRKRAMANLFSEKPCQERSETIEKQGREREIQTEKNQIIRWIIEMDGWIDNRWIIDNM